MANLLKFQTAAEFTKSLKGQMVLLKQFVSVRAILLAVAIGCVISYCTYQLFRYKTNAGDVQSWIAALPPDSDRETVKSFLLNKGFIVYDLAAGDNLNANVDVSNHDGIQAILTNADRGFSWRKQIWVRIQFDRDGHVKHIEVREQTLGL